MTSAVSTHADTKTKTSPGPILAIILISYFMILLDNSVIFTGLPSIRAGLDLSPSALSWVQDAYTLVFGGLLLLAARAGDIWGGVGSSSSGWPSSARPRCSSAWPRRAGG